MTLRFGNNTVSRGPQPTPPSVPPPLARGFIVGRTERGPVNTPTRVRDYDEFRAIFGAGSDSNGTADIADQARDYFRSVGGSSDAIVLRLYEGDPSGGLARETAAAGAYRVVAVAPGPGQYGNALERAVVVEGAGENQTITVYARELVNGIVVASRTTPAVPLTPAGIRDANTYLTGLLSLAFDEAGAEAAAQATAPGAPLSWVRLSGGSDSVAISTSTLRGTVNDDTQARTGLEIIRSSRYGGGAIVAPGFSDDEGRTILYAFAAATMRIVPDGPPSELLISGGVADYQAARLIPGAEYAGYWYPLKRVTRGGVVQNRQAIGALAGLLVASVMRREGYVAPPAGETVISDIQRSVDGAFPLVTDANMSQLTSAGLNVLVARNRVEAQGLALVTSDPLQPATTKLHHRLIANALAYDLGPVLSQFDNTYVDAKGAFYSAVKSEMLKRLKRFHDSGVLYGVSLADAVQVRFAFEQTPDEELERTGRVKVTINYKVSGVSEGIDLALGHVPINTRF